MLINLLVELGRKPEHHGSLSGAVHRGWVGLIGAVRSRSVIAILRECDRGEIEALIVFRKVLELDLPSDVEEVVRGQLHRIHEAADELRDLRRRLELERLGSVDALR